MFAGCTPGEYCEESGLWKTSGLCESGFYCSGNASRRNPTDSYTGDVCPVGSFCPIGSKLPQPCENGTYMNTTGIGPPVNFVN